ncbi:OLC1v1013099C1 [Oldenlandia corymbosa var. corymbosa]|uniref:OLC1v1013099C1 n=1 Tax=Oldenlandia corymbosa var. corymbosa TaxID=529605 RepID=A0AAV1DXF4_OLDCO|nr:OLC1v1013099C1 [Oldenlandia corymbosa var. corymbosa]
MTSNFTAGERRWASARRTGMTVLGKVAVPKPLNLPSQRLENHGQDRDVEIVPKRTVGWGGRPSSSNPWGSTALSPNADGSASSPSQLSGRPSSAGTGSRPSTAGSETALERPANSWGPSSRPSSASGVLPSNQSSTTLRPHSADTRTSSSQRSRLAEVSPENSTVQAARSAVEQVGLLSSENERFSLSSGEFPTLGASKDGSARTSEPKDHDSHSRPTSAPGKNEKTETSQADAHDGTFSSWNRDGPQNSDDGTLPGPSKWHGEPQQYHDANIPPPQFDAWRGPPPIAPHGGWYRGPPTAPPYGPPVGPGGFPIEPYPYYCPQIPPPGLANSQPVPMPGASPRGHNHPKNGELYRPQMPDAFVHPRMPFRPGFYRGPVPYEGYYGPPMGYGPNDRDLPHKGMARPSVHNRYSNPGSGHSHVRAGRNGPTGRMLSEHEETAHHGDASFHSRVLLKHNEWEGKEDKRITEHMPISNSSQSNKNGQFSTASTRREWGADVEGEEELYSAVILEGGHDSLRFDNDEVRCDPEVVKFKPNVRNSMVESGPINQQITVASSPRVLETPVKHVAVTAGARDPTLMQKIEGLNVKVRRSDGRNEGLLTLESDGHKFRSQHVDMNTDDVSTKVGNFDGSHEKVPALNKMVALPGERTSTSGNRSSQPAQSCLTLFSYLSRRPSEFVHGRGSDNNGRHKKPVATELSGVLAANTPSSHVHASIMQPAVMDVELTSGNNGGDLAAEIVDSADSQAQRAKMKELAKQRALQLQKEEDERIKEQKAKALAKLEELNRRTQGGASESETVFNPAGKELEELRAWSELSTVAAKSETKKPATVQHFDNVTQLCVGTVPLEPIFLGGQSLAVTEEANDADASRFRTSPKPHDGSVSRQKRNSSKPKHNVQQPKNMGEHSQVISTSDAAKDKSSEVKSVATVDILLIEESNLQRNATLVVESPSQQKKKSYKSIRKLKPDEAIPVSVPPLVAVADSCPVEGCAENENFNDDQSGQGFGLAQGVVAGSSGADSAKQHSSSHAEDSHGRVNNHRKPQHSRRLARNQLSGRPVDKFHSNDNVMWAPVRSQNNSELAKEISQETLQQSVSSSKSDHQVLTSSKSKRAEMERYIPKPVAKELAQQGSILQPLTSGEAAEGVETRLGSSGSLQAGSSGSHHVSTEGRETNKQARGHGAWRQRGSAEAPSSGSSSSTSNVSKNARKSVGQSHSMMPEVVSEKGEEKLSRDLGSDQNVFNEAEAAVPVGTSSVRDQVATGKVKRHALKAEKNSGSSYGAEKHVNTGEADRNHTQFSDSDIRQPKDNHGFEERGSSQWQPKSHPSSNNSQRSGRSLSVRDDAGGMSGVKKSFSSQTRSHVIPRIKEFSGKDVSQLDQYAYDNKMPEFVDAGHQGHRKEKKVSTSMGPATEVAVGFEESTNAVTADGKNKQSSDIRSRNQNNYLGPSPEYQGDWGHERHRPNTHYEYHPVGSQNNSKPDKVEGSLNVGPKYKDRGHIQSKRGRGNFHGRQSSSVRVDAGSG